MNEFIKLKPGVYVFPETNGVKSRIVYGKCGASANLEWHALVIYPKTFFGGYTTRQKPFYRSFGSFEHAEAWADERIRNFLTLDDEVSK